MGVIFTVMLVIASLVMVGGVLFLLQGPPYVASDPDAIMTVVAYVQKYQPQRILDVGTGKGDLLLPIARQGFAIDGIDLNPKLAWQLKRQVSQLGQKDNVNIYCRDMWRFNMSQYDLLVMYLANPFMPRLEQKLKKELKPGSYIISNHCSFPTLNLVEQKGRIKAYRI